MGNTATIIHNSNCSKPAGLVELSLKSCSKAALEEMKGRDDASDWVRSAENTLLSSDRSCSVWRRGAVGGGLC